MLSMDIKKQSIDEIYHELFAGVIIHEYMSKQTCSTKTTMFCCKLLRY